MNADGMAKPVVPEEVAKRAKHLDAMLAKLTEVGTRVEVTILAAIVRWIIGRRLVNKPVSLLEKALLRRKVDPTLSAYISSFPGATPNIVPVMAILGYFGVDTTTFAALSNRWLRSRSASLIATRASSSGRARARSRRSCRNRHRT